MTTDDRSHIPHGSSSTVAAGLPCLVDDRTGRTWPLRPGDNSIGRKRDAAVCIEDLAVSRSHCSIRIEGGRATLRLESTSNPTAVDGVVISAERYLQDGEVVKVGDTLLRFAHPRSTPNATVDPDATVVSDRKLASFSPSPRAGTPDRSGERPAAIPSPPMPPLPPAVPLGARRVDPAMLPPPQAVADAYAPPATAPEPPAAPPMPAATAQRSDEAQPIQAASEVDGFLPPIPLPPPPPPPEPWGISVAQPPGDPVMASAESALSPLAHASAPARLEETSVASAAPLAPRLVAFALDEFIVFVAAWTVPVLLVFFMLPEGITAPNSVYALLLLGGGMTVLVYPLYFGVLDGAARSTPGKHLCGLRVRRIDGTPISFGQGLLRGGLHLLCMLPLGLGLAVALIGQQRRGLHDLVAGTVVCSAEDR